MSDKQTFEEELRTALDDFQDGNMYLRHAIEDILAAHQATLDAAVAQARLELIDEVYRLSPTKQFKDWKPTDALAFYERLKELEAAQQDKLIKECL